MKIEPLIDLFFKETAKSRSKKKIKGDNLNKCTIQKPEFF